MDDPAVASHINHLAREFVFRVAEAERTRLIERIKALPEDRLSFEIDAGGFNVEVGGERVREVMLSLLEEAGRGDAA